MMRFCLSALLVLSLNGANTFAVDQNLIDAMKRADTSAEVERRPKFLTDGSYDTADPTNPIQIELPGGRKVWMVIFSGGTVIYTDSLEQLLRGGMHKLHDIDFFFADGGKVTTKPYRINAAPWDPDLAFFTAAEGPRVVGFAGMMQKCNPAVEPVRAKDNWTRSRHSFQVEIREENGEIRQTWKDLGSIHGYRPCEQAESPWLGSRHAHGYGSHYIEDESGKPFLFFDEVTEQREVKGWPAPYRTEILMRPLDESRTRAAGPKQFALRDTPAGASRPYRAAERSIGGYLIEGPHLIEVNLNGTDYYLMFFSTGDAFTDQYGSFYAYRLKSQGLEGPFTAAVDEKGQLINFTASLTKKIDGTWGIGRPNPFRDERGRYWVAAHVILKQEIPDNEVKSGWPPTFEELLKRARRSMIIPINIDLRDGKPWVQTLD